MATEVIIHRESTAGDILNRQSVQLIEVDIDTDANGDGSITVDFIEGGGRTFQTTPFVVFDETSDPAAVVNDITDTSIDIGVSGSDTTDGTTTVRCIVRGRRD